MARLEAGMIDGRPGSGSPAIPDNSLSGPVGPRGAGPIPPKVPCLRPLAFQASGRNPGIVKSRTHARAASGQSMVWATILVVRVLQASTWQVTASSAAPALETRPPAH